MFIFRRFNLIDPKETDVLRDLEIALRLTEDQQSTTTTTTTTTTTAVGTTNSNSNSSDHNTTNSSDDGDLLHHIPQTSLIDGDATIKPIVTQPESIPQPSGGEHIITSEILISACGGPNGGGGIGGGSSININTNTTA